ncbi:MAG: hypothetical protein WCO60_04310 [Verrucomicrobiota bacterium]
MRWLPPILGVLLTTAVLASDNDALHKEIRLIRRAYLDVLQLLPTAEEIDWYVVYNQNGYFLAVEYLTRRDNSNGWKAEDLLDSKYREQPDREIDQTVLEKNVIYLAGIGKGEATADLFESGAEKFILNALKASDENTSNTIDYMITQLTCRPSTAEEENEMAKLFGKVSMKSDEMSAWKTVLIHILKMHDCKFK